MCKNEERKDMTTIREIKPLEVHFEEEKDREDFIKWAYSKEKSNNPSLERMRREMKNIRRIRMQSKRSK